jgi:hypothetical protein
LLEVSSDILCGILALLTLRMLRADWAVTG